MCSSSIATSSKRRQRSWACSRRSRLRRRCRSSPRRTTARRSAFSSAAGRGEPDERRQGIRADPQGGADRRGNGRADALPGAQQHVRSSAPSRVAALLEGGLRHRAHRRRDQGAPRIRPEGSGGELDDAHLSDQRGMQPRGRRRDGVRLSRCEIRDRHRRHVAGSCRQRKEHQVGEGLLPAPSIPIRQPAGMSTSWPATIRIGSGTTTRGTTTGWSRSRGSTTRPTCST